jgi:predicted AAA+ superfamily ATPase
MKRSASTFLDQWIEDSQRKPLVLRGARQVGKTWLVRDLAQRHGLRLVELNMERRPELADHFRANDPQRAVSDLSADLGISISSETCLLFIDEVQATPHLLSFLRWFREEMPEMPVVAAGSLLDFALREHAFSMPVGRISYCYLEPFSFYEFLDASGNERLKAALIAAGESLDIAPRLHQRALALFAEYCLCGGLPEVISDWIAKHDDARRLQLQRDLIATYRDDFNKYRGRISADLLRRVMDALPRQLGGRFVYSHVDGDAKHRDLKQALELLRLARVCHRVEHTAANGLPLGAETNPGLFKVILVDVGLAAVQMGFSRLDLRDLDAVVWANKGGIAEQFVGQHLRCLSQAYEDPGLFYWQRTEGRQAEIDYVIQHGSHVVPVEVKAGKAGSMKSLHAFMQAKKFPCALRLDINPPSSQDVDVMTTTAASVKYRLLSLPLYMAESIPAVLRAHGTFADSPSSAR